VGIQWAYPNNKGVYRTLGLAGDHLEKAAPMQPFLPPSRILTKADYQHFVHKRGPAGHHDVGYKLYYHSGQAYYLLTYTDKTGKTEVIATCHNTRLADDLYDLCTTNAVSEKEDGP
jgi:hypothetical protein